MMIFSYQYNEDEPLIIFKLPPETDLLETINEFEHFLQAAGYNFDGRLALVEDPEECDCSQDDIRNCPNNKDDEDPIRYN